MKIRGILVFLFLIIFTCIFFFFKQTYDNKIVPVNKKIEEYNKLKLDKSDLKKQIKEQKVELEKILEKEKENNEKKEQYEKIIYEHQIKNSGKVVYLTFDDGPSQYTNEILQTLDKYNVKATFFVTCSDNLEKFSKKIVEKGHTIALHTCTHKYSDVYASDENYFNDLNRISSLVEQYTNIKSKYIRFPGGSSNTVSKNYSRGIMSRLAKRVTDEGYRYYDCNVDSNDAGGANSEQVYSNVIGSLKNSNRNTSVVLMHDTKVATKDALDSIIKDALDMGYVFSKINDYTPQVHHGINN